MSGILSLLDVTIGNRCFVGIFTRRTHPLKERGREGYDNYISEILHTMQWVISVSNRNSDVGLETE